MRKIVHFQFFIIIRYNKKVSFIVCFDHNIVSQRFCKVNHYLEQVVYMGYSHISSRLIMFYFIKLLLNQYLLTIKS